MCNVAMCLNLNKAQYSCEYRHIVFFDFCRNIAVYNSFKPNHFVLHQIRMTFSHFKYMLDLYSHYMEFA